MAHVFFALVRSMASFNRPGVWRYLIWPPLIGGALWLLATIFWLGVLMDWLLVATPLSWLNGLLVDWHLGWVATALAFIGGWVILLGGAYLITIIIAGVWALPGLVRVVSQTEYPDVSARGRDSVLLSVGVTLKATIGYLVGWVVTLPIWLVPGMAVVHSFFWIAYLNRACFAFDAIAPLASRDEWEQIKLQHGGRLWSLGLMAAVLAHIPLIGFFAPALGALSFVHYGMQALRDLRGLPSGGVLSGTGAFAGRAPSGEGAIDGEFRREGAPGGAKNPLEHRP